VCILLTKIKHLFLGFIGITSSDEALRDEFVLLLAGLRSLCLLQDLSSAGSTLSGRGEFSHVFSVSLDLFLFGIDTASEEAAGGGDGRRTRERGKNSESLGTANSSDGQNDKNEKLLEHGDVCIKLQSKCILR